VLAVDGLPLHRGPPAAQRGRAVHAPRRRRRVRGATPGVGGARLGARAGRARGLIAALRRWPCMRSRVRRAVAGARAGGAGVHGVQGAARGAACRERRLDRGQAARGRRVACARHLDLVMPRSGSS